jgi:hypothetical protein
LMICYLLTSKDIHNILYISKKYVSGMHGPLTKEPHIIG